MAKLTLVFILLLSSAVFANSYISGEGRFYSKDHDSLSFVKKQLLYNAFKDVITKELQSMGLDQEKFWASYDEKFQKYFEPISENLKKKYGVEEDKVSKVRKENYEKALRSKKLYLLSRYGSLNKNILSYSVRKMTRSPQYPNSRYILVNAKVDRKTLHKTYLRFTSEAGDRTFQTLFLSVDFDIKNMSWADTGVELESDFTDVIKQHWKEWFEKKTGDLFQEIVITNDSYERDLNEFLRIPKETKEAMLEGVQSMDSDQIVFSNSLWLKVNVEIEKVQEDKLLQYRDFKTHGDFVLLDLRTNQPVEYADIDREKNRYNIANQKDFSSQLASSIYRQPMATFEDLSRSILSFPGKMKTLEVVVKNAQNIQDIFALSKFLTKKGVIYQLTPALDNYNGEDAVMKISFRGKKQDIVKFIRGLNRYNFTDDKQIQLDKESDFSINILRSNKSEGLNKEG